MRAIGLTLTMALAAAGCATTQTAATTEAPAPRVSRNQPPAPPTLDGDWRLALLRDAPQGARLSATLRIADDRAEGASDCGAWTAQARNFGMDLRFDRLTGAGAQACSDQIRLLDGKYRAALSAARTVQMREGYLVLMDQHGSETLFFARDG